MMPLEWCAVDVRQTTGMDAGALAATIPCRRTGPGRAMYVEGNDKHMNTFRKAVESIHCPTCGALPGNACIPPTPKLSYWHFARISARPISKAVIGQGVIGGPYVKGRNPSGYCERHQHKLCSGRSKREFGMEGPRCTCSCHHSI